MGRHVAVAVVAAALAVPAANAGSREDGARQHYLAAMSWPVRASLLRTQSLARALDCAVRLGDGPCWRGVAANCRSLRAVEDRGHLLRLVAPATLRTSHSTLRRAYSALRDDCVQARWVALAVATAGELAALTKDPADRAIADRAARDGRTALRRFARTRKDPFVTAVRAWRAAAVGQLSAAGLAVPAWLRALSP